MSKHSVKCPGCGLEGVLNDEQYQGQASARCGCGHEWTPVPTQANPQTDVDLQMFKVVKPTKRAESVQPQRETFGGKGRRK